MYFSIWHQHTASTTTIVCFFIEHTFKPCRVLFFNVYYTVKCGQNVLLGVKNNGIK